MCIRQGHYHALKTLLDVGAYPNFMEFHGAKSTPYDYAKTSGHIQCAELIASYGGVDFLAMQEVATTMIQAAWRGMVARKAVRALRAKAAEAHEDDSADGDAEGGGSRQLFLATLCADMEML